MADTEKPFEYCGGFGCGPFGSQPFGSNFTDENLGPPRPDILALPVTYEDRALEIHTDDE